ncbi:hypothetical protein BWD14_20795 [Leptospira santarosai]|uniref:RND transporter, Hydrophobe/Amphiphile Efflux-1 (HAE1)/Heavy Metal Efflux (HME) family, permease protein n=1 Tax=Leptospira santarosai TaxID=28183 RepID=A0AB73MD33_9LEPT|nr:hypothetical protein BWD14_20795 [Leptospira santarosai]
MIRTLLEGVLRFRLATLIASVASIVFGTWAWIDIRKEAYSDIADTQVRLIAKFPGKAAVEVEERVTIPIERVLNAIPKVAVRRSRTINGLWYFNSYSKTERTIILQGPDFWKEFGTRIFLRRWNLRWVR